MSEPTTVGVEFSMAYSSKEAAFLILCDDAEVSTQIEKFSEAQKSDIQIAITSIHTAMSKGARKGKEDACEDGCAHEDSQYAWDYAKQAMTEVPAERLRGDGWKLDVSFDEDTEKELPEENTALVGPGEDSTRIGWVSVQTEVNGQPAQGLMRVVLLRDDQ